MMKRTGVQRLGPDDPQPLQQSQSVNVNIQQASASNMHTLAQSAQPQLLGATTMLSVSGMGNVNVGVGGVGVSGLSVGGVVGGFRGARAPQPVPSYLKPATVQYAAKQPQITIPPRHKPLGSQSPGPSPSPLPAPPLPTPPAQFQRLKVEDALSYLDQVKFKFNTQPQVYNDFLDIMKEFKSQTIDTPGVITRVSTLFKGHPELIVGFNTFLPPGYKIEVQSNGLVSVSMPSPTALGAGGVLLGVHHAPQPPLVHLLPVPQSVSSAIVHNLSAQPVVTGAPAGAGAGVGGAPPSNTLHHISQAHQQLEAAATIQHQHHAAGGAAAAAGAAPGQPVEFNHAIEYVNKIKSRFSRQPDKYKRFLEILHAYQRGHRDVKQPLAKQQTEQEVYSQVAKLFENQDDLLAEFGQFLPDAKTVAGKHHYPSPHAPLSPPPHQLESDSERYSAPPPSPPPAPPPHTAHVAPAVPKLVPPPTAPPPPQHHLKRSPSFGSAAQLQPVGAPAAKKPRVSLASGVTSRDVSLAEAAKHGTLQEYNYFDRVRRALRSQEVYDNFLRCLLLFTNEIISSSELVCVTAPFLCKHPELQRWLQHFVAPHEPEPRRGYDYESGGAERAERGEGRGEGRARYEPLGPLAAQLRLERPQGDAAMDIDLSTCKRLGTSYCALPRGSAEAASRRCSGRTPLCKEVLNDTWVSFPTWSEDSTFVTSRKTQYEEHIYRCEDERFELDVVIETNASTIRVLEGVAKRLARMSAAEAARLRLDECLGGASPTQQQRALRRIYGDKAVDIIAGLKKNPAVAVPVVLRRLKAKEEEWREAQKGFNKQWREQNEKYYLKSLDHQGINFKQNDLKALRSKSLFNEVEAAFAARRPPPHVVQDYGVSCRQEAIKIVRDANELLIHHARRQTGIQKGEKRRIKLLLRRFIPDLFRHPRLPHSDDERDDDDKEEACSGGSAAEEAPEEPSDKDKDKENTSESDDASEKSTKHNKNNKENTPKNNNNTDSKECPLTVKRSSSREEVKELKEEEEDLREYPPNEARFVCTSSWYLFLRLHGVLCTRLAGARAAAAALRQSERAAPPSAAAALRLKPHNLPPDAASPAHYYAALLELVRGVLDGNTDSAAFEDAAREMLGIRAYPAYTLDKLVSHAVRQLQHCVSEPWSVRAGELAARAAGGAGRGGAQYVRRARRYLRQHHSAFLVKIYGGDDCRVTFELVEGAGEGAHLEPPPALTSNGAAAAHRVAAWSLYTERYTRGAGGGGGGNKPVFLRRNARRRGGRAADNAAPCPAPAAPPPPPHARRKPQVLDRSECTLQARLRMVAVGGHWLYRRGSLRAARVSLPALSAARRARFRAWLRRREPPAL